MKRASLLSLAVLAASAFPLAAQEVSLGAPPILRIPLEDQNQPAPGPGLRPAGPEIRQWFELSANASFDFMAYSFLSGNIYYSDVYGASVGFDFQAALAYAWIGGWGWWFQDGYVRPHVGWSYHNFPGQSFRDSTGVTVSPHDLTINNVYAGITLGGGKLPDGPVPGFMPYATLQVGASFFNRTGVDVSTSVGTQPLIDATTAFYISGGIGAEIMWTSLSLRIEGGLRSFGTPKDAGGPVILSSDSIVAYYLLIGLTAAF